VHDHKIEKQTPGSQDKKSDTLMGGLLNGVYILWAGPSLVAIRRDPTAKKGERGRYDCGRGSSNRDQKPNIIVLDNQKMAKAYRLQSRKKSTIDQQLKR
jgi:hypothetical protein